MGQKGNPHGMRVGVIKDWDSRWFTSKQEFGDTLVEDHKIRKTLKKRKRQLMNLNQSMKTNEYSKLGKTSNMI